MGSEREITGKIFIITGAASGLGAACTEAFLKEGAKHIAILDVAEENGKELEQRLNKAYGPARARYMQCDVSNDEQFADAFKKVLEEYGRIDVLINNAGILDEKRHQKLIEINLMAVVAGSYRALDMMRCERGGSGGTIINISSVAGLRTIHITPTYCATKSAVLAFSQCLGGPFKMIMKDSKVCKGPKRSDCTKIQFVTQPGRQSALVTMEVMQATIPETVNVLWFENGKEKASTPLVRLNVKKPCDHFYFQHFFSMINATNSCVVRKWRDWIMPANRNSVAGQYGSLLVNGKTLFMVPPGSPP